MADADGYLSDSNPPSPLPKLRPAVDSAPVPDQLSAACAATDEVLASAAVTKELTKDDVATPAPATPVAKKKKAAGDPTAPGAPKKKKPKKKALVSASPTMDSAPRYYYDIQNFIVTSGVDLEQFGLLPKNAETTVRSTVSSTGGKRVSLLPAAETIPSGCEVKCEETELQSTFTYPSGMRVTPGVTLFCPDCGLRLLKHKEKRGTKGGKAATFFCCPSEIVQ